MSFWVVEVPWALMYSTASGGRAASSRALHGQDGPLGGGVGVRDAVGVRRIAIAQHLAQDRRAAGAGVLQVLEHQDAGALAHHEAVALAVEGAGGGLGARVLLGHGLEQLNPTKPMKRSESQPPATAASARPSRMNR